MPVVLDETVNDNDLMFAFVDDEIAPQLIFRLYQGVDGVGFDRHDHAVGLPDIIGLPPVSGSGCHYQTLMESISSGICFTTSERYLEHFAS